MMRATGEMEKTATAPVGRAEDRSAEVRYSAHSRRRHRDDFLFPEQTGVAFLYAQDFPAAVDRREHRGTNHRVGPGASPPPVDNAILMISGFFF